MYLIIGSQLHQTIAPLLIVDLVAKPRGIGNRQPQADSLLLDNCVSYRTVRYGCNLCCFARHVLGVDQMRREYGIHQRALAQPCAPDDHQVEVEAALLELAVDLLGDCLKADVGIKRGLCYR